MFSCVTCGTPFERRGSRGPLPRYCSPVCGRVPFKGRKREYDQQYHASYYAKNRDKILAHGHRYNRRPEVRERNRIRMAIKWHTDPEYRARQLARWSSPFAGVEVPAPYTGHMWLERMRQLVAPSLDDSSLNADYYHDQMGEALLAFLEGRDPSEAVREFKRREFVPRNMTLSLSEWKDDPDNTDRWFDSVVPPTPSAEDEAVARETAVYYLKTRYHHGENGRPMRGGRDRQQPHRRRMRDGRGWMKHGTRRASGGQDYAA